MSLTTRHITLEEDDEIVEARSSSPGSADSDEYETQELSASALDEKPRKARITGGLELDNIIRSPQRSSRLKKRRRGSSESLSRQKHRLTRSIVGTRKRVDYDMEHHPMDDVILGEAHPVRKAPCDEDSYNQDAPSAELGRVKTLSRIPSRRAYDSQYHPMDDLMDSQNSGKITASGSISLSNSQSGRSRAQDNDPSSSTSSDQFSVNNFVAPEISHPLDRVIAHKWQELDPCYRRLFLLQKGAPAKGNTLPMKWSQVVSRLVSEGFMTREEFKAWGKPKDLMNRYEQVRVHLQYVFKAKDEPANRKDWKVAFMEGFDVFNLKKGDTYNGSRLLQSPVEVKSNDQDHDSRTIGIGGSQDGVGHLEQVTSDHRAAMLETNPDQLRDAGEVHRLEYLSDMEDASQTLDQTPEHKAAFLETDTDQFRDIGEIHRIGLLGDMENALLDSGSPLDQFPVTEVNEIVLGQRESSSDSCHSSLDKDSLSQIATSVLQHAAVALTGNKSETSDNGEVSATKSDVPEGVVASDMRKLQSMADSSNAGEISMTSLEDIETIKESMSDDGPAENLAQFPQDVKRSKPPSSVWTSVQVWTDVLEKGKSFFTGPSKPVQKTPKEQRPRKELRSNPLLDPAVEKPRKNRSKQSISNEGDFVIYDDSAGVQADMAPDRIAARASSQAELSKENFGIPDPTAQQDFVMDDQSGDESVLIPPGTPVPRSTITIMIPSPGQTSRSRQSGTLSAVGRRPNLIDEISAVASNIH
ncbi:hypothetical protein MMC09_007113 [Bachmanniomyces sp. S44760]|nr:hypothetical protein [Bachmanniomyces sp. S44760]